MFQYKINRVSPAWHALSLSLSLSLVVLIVGVGAPTVALAASQGFSYASVTDNTARIIQGFEDRLGSFLIDPVRSSKLRPAFQWSLSEAAYASRRPYIELAHSISNGVDSPALGALPALDVTFFTHTLGGGINAFAQTAKDVSVSLVARFKTLFSFSGNGGVSAPLALTLDDLSSLTHDVATLKATLASSSRASPETKALTERVIERIQPVTEITNVLNTETKTIDALSLARIDAVLADLGARISSNASRQTANVQNISVGQRIDTLRNITFTGTENKFNLTDANIPDDITAANYLPLAGGTLSGALSISKGGANIIGNLTINGNTIVSGGSLNVGDKIIAPGEVGIGTTTPGAKFAIQNSSSTEKAFLLYGTTTQSANLFDIYNNPTSNTNLFTVTAAGNIGVGTSSPSSVFGVTGTSTLSGISNAGFITTTGNAYIGGSLTSAAFTVTNATTTSLAITDSFIANVATSTITNAAIANLTTSNLTATGTTLNLLGSLLVNAASSTITNLNVASLTLGTALSVANGGTGDITFTSGQLIYGNGTAALSSVATSSATCSSGISCTSFAVVGSGGSTITNTLGYPFTPT